ncbi:MAG: hypothetical protein ACYDCL_02140 [Myxococcales bacterium]
MLARRTALLALSTFTLGACCSQKLVEVPVDDGGTGNLWVTDEPDSGVDAGERDAGPRDAGIEKDAGVERDAGLDAGERDAGRSTSGGSTGGSTGTIGGGGNTGGSGGGSTGGIAGGGGTGGSGGYVDAGPTCAQDPDLSGDWTMSSDYDMTVAVQNGGLPGVVQAFVDINNFLAAIAAFGVPVPQWATTLFGNLANLQQLFQDINVQSDLMVTPGGNSMTYGAQETWQSVSVLQNGAWTALNSNVGFTSPPAYTITTCSGVATLSQHDLGGAIGSLIPSVIDAIVNISTCANGQCYASLDAAVNAALDCSQYAFGSSAWVYCTGESAALESELTNALNGINFPVGVCTVAGTATIQPGAPLQLVNGVWTGQLSGVPFPGTFSAVHN